MLAKWRCEINCCTFSTTDMLNLLKSLKGTFSDLIESEDFENNHFDSSYLQNTCKRLANHRYSVRLILDKFANQKKIRYKTRDPER